MPEKQIDRQKRTFSEIIIHCTVFVCIALLFKISFAILEFAFFGIILVIRVN